MDRAADAVLVECGHGGLCTACADSLWRHGAHAPGGRCCPLCRRPFIGVMHILSETECTVRTQHSLSPSFSLLHPATSSNRRPTHRLLTRCRLVQALVEPQHYPGMPEPPIEAEAPPAPAPTRAFTRTTWGEIVPAAAAPQRAAARPRPPPLW